MFPCPSCGADLEFSIDQQSLKCGFCGHVQELTPSDREIEENDYHVVLEQSASRHDTTGVGQDDLHEVPCQSCGAKVLFQGTLTSWSCPYCGSTLQRDKVHDAEDRLRVDAVLPFLVPRDKAMARLKDWVQSRWFAPNDFRQLGGRGTFNGCYFPYFTFDSATFTRYSGERGNRYAVTVGTGKDQRTEWRTDWYPASGQFQRFFDDVLVLALRDDQRALLQELEPWPLGQARPYTPEVLAGFVARTYDISLDRAFEQARARIDSALRQDVRQRIGGDEQRVHQQKTAYNAITFKHVLLPVWLLAYRYHDRTYRVTVNAATGEVNGERPWSWIKISLTVLVVAGIVGLIMALGQR